MTSRVGLGAWPLELLVCQVLPADPAAEGLPELRLQGAAGDPAILRLVGPVADDRAGEHHLSPPRHLARAEIAGGLHHQPAQRAIGHRDVDHLPLSAAPRLVERRQDPDRGHHPAAAQVGDLSRGLNRGPAGLPGEAQQAVEAKIVHVVAGPITVWAVLAVAGDRAVDEGRVRLPERLVADAEAIEHARAKALDQDVGRLRQPEQCLLSPFLLQIEPDGALVPVQRQVERRAGPQGRLLVRAVERRRPANVVAGAGVLDLDHIGAEVGEQERAEAPGQEPGEVQDPHVGEGALRHSLAASVVSIGWESTSRLVGSSRFGTPSISRASATVAARRPTSSDICRALAISSPFDFAISPLGR